MIQKTYECVTKEELLQEFERIAKDPDYAAAKTRVVEILAECWDEDILSEIVSEGKRLLPEATFAGMTNFYTYWTSGGGYDENAVHFGITLLLFREADARILSFPTREDEEDQAGIAANFELLKIPDLKAVQVIASGVFMVIDDFLRTATKGLEEIPFFGLKSAPALAEKIDGKVFTGDGILKNWVILLIVFSGEKLSVRTSYNLGWIPIGKEMTITRTSGDFEVDRIDDEPAAEIYRKYLGLSPEQIIVANTSEFPLLINHGGWLVGRAGAQHTTGGRLVFSAPVSEGEAIRFSYGNPNQIFHETYGDSREIEYEGMEGVLIVACGNRQLFLGEDEEKEIDFYREVCPSSFVFHGHSEVLTKEGGGGELNSALITLSFREGEAQHPASVRWDCDKSNCPTAREEVPLVQRLLHFLEATTGELLQMAKAAKVASEAKSSFISNMSHEIRTPINSVLGLDEMILRESTEPEIRRYAEDIKVAGRTLLSLINDILDMSRIESGKMTIVPVEYELSSMLNDLVNMITVRAKEKGLDFIVNVDPKMPHLLFGDDTRIKQCALNILTNAVKYTREGSVTLTVGFQKTVGEEGELCVSVADTGIGIKEEDMTRLFSRFERIDEEKNRTVEGTGLGMSIVRQLLALMGTELTVKSVYGEGSEFSFRVKQRVVSMEPIGNFTEMYEKSLEGAERYRESFHAPEGKVLVVDDTRMNLTVFTALLKGTELSIDTADSGFQALELVKQKKYDVIFLDQRMPEMDGIQTLHRMKEQKENRNQNTPCICLTANAVSGAREMFLAAGFDNYLSKPINGMQLEKMLMDVLPPEKVYREGTKEYEETPQSGEKQKEELSEETEKALLKFRELPEINYAKALENCMREDILLDAVKAFFATAKTGADEIEKLLADRDIKNYTVKVHALKSSSRIIGAEALSEKAAYLEKRGDEGDLPELTEKTPQLLAAYRNLSKSLAFLETDLIQSEEAELPELPADQLQGAYEGIREFVSAFDFDGAEDILSMLRDYRVPKEEEERLQGIRDGITKLDRDGVLKLLSK